ncbi:MAG: hypothetical protein EOO79_08050 [Oxalobacteraceae bacterium]|nr:MAG: hypothetical protein EOO79_08050 [Oxalobacteraceae bacterium]
MKIPYVVAMIRKDAVEELPVVVGAHEVGILQMVHGEDKVYVDEDADLPKGMTETEDFDVEDEYARLEQRYGLNVNTKMSNVSMAFGGLDGFMDAMEKADQADGAPTARKTSKATKRAAAAKHTAPHQELAENPVGDQTK